jgi:NAD(P)-dependent dehydrogenase (short-subunit alcohol dehydrogenase family)
VLPADVGDDEQVREAVAAVLARHRRVDAVVNSAGVVAYGRTEEIPPHVVEGVLRTNVFGPVNVARHVLPVMRAADRGGTLLLVGSVIGHIAVPTRTPYAVSKWGVRALARQLQLENRDRPRVRVGYVAPGGVDTPIHLQGANTTAWVGRPPPPVDSPERVAYVLLRQLDRPRPRRKVGRANDVMRFGFSAMPWVFDLLVGRLFPVAAMDRTTAAPMPTPRSRRNGMGSSDHELVTRRPHQSALHQRTATHLCPLRPLRSSACGGCLKGQFAQPVVQQRCHRPSPRENGIRCCR